MHMSLYCLLGPCRFLGVRAFHHQPCPWTSRYAVDPSSGFFSYRRARLNGPTSAMTARVWGLLKRLGLAETQGYSG